MWGYILSFILGCLVTKHFKSMRSRLFAAFMNKMDQKFEPKFVAWKASKLKGLKEMKSSFPEMQENNSIKLLEVGFGQGANFKYYPEDCHLVVVDPNPFFKQYYDANRSKYPHIKSEEIIVAAGEDMDMIPDNSVDAVVITYVLCSAADVPKIMKQVVRVLVPGGKLFFFEHIKEWNKAKSFVIFLQNVLTYSGIWPFIFDQCELNRETLPHILNAGFSNVEFEREHAPGDSCMLAVIGPTLTGVATK